MPRGAREDEEEFALLSGREEPPGGEPADDDQVRAALRASIDSGASTRDAVSEVANSTGRIRREVYALAVSLPERTK